MPPREEGQDRRNHNGLEAHKIVGVSLFLATSPYHISHITYHIWGRAGSVVRKCGCR
jgi:hypothetical protein